MRGVHAVPMTPRPRVLVVDDDDSVRRAPARAIRRAGLDVQAFRSAEALLAYGLPEREACLVLAILPYLLIRGSVDRIARRW